MNTTTDAVIRKLRADGFIDAAMNNISVQETTGFQAAEAVAKELSRLRAEEARLVNENAELRGEAALSYDPAIVGDAARYRWLTADHESGATREKCREILGRISVMSYSAASAAIDAAIAAKGE